MLDRLNDDCELHIIQYLDLPSQLALKRISESWAANVHYHWRHQTKFTLSDYLEEFRGSHDILEFLQQICGVVVELHLGRLRLKQLQAWRALQFPNVRTLNWQRFYCRDDDEGEDDDAHVRLLAELFPALNKLELLSATTGKHLWALRHLTDLHLSCCESLDAGTFERIFYTLKLKKLTLLYYGYNTVLDERIEAISKCDTLEELEIDDHHILYDLMRLLLELPNFRKLTCYTRDYHEHLIFKLARRRGSDVRSILFHDVFWASDRLLDALLLMPLVRSVIFNADDIETEQFEKLTIGLPFLEQFHFTYSRQVLDVEILHLIKNCPSLTVIDISGTRISKDYLTEHQNEILSALYKRRQPLRLHCNGCGLDEQQIKHLLQHPLLEIFMEPVEVDMPSARFFRIELEPLSA